MSNQELRIVVTDSGLGGLYVAARLYEWTKQTPGFEPVKVIFANALPETSQGYNKMESTALKIATFDRVLWGIERNFHPDIIAIACNTLSVLADQTGYFAENKEKLSEVVSTGIEEFLSLMDSEDSSLIAILATETTIESDVHRQKLILGGTDPKLIFTQACPNLASAIEKDPNSPETLNIVERCVRSISGQIPSIKPDICVYLGCTHYGYISEFIAAQFRGFGFENVRIFNANDSLVKELQNLLSSISQQKAVSGLTSIEVFSRCEFLPEEIQSISALILPISPDTARALQHYTLNPDLF